MFKGSLVALITPFRDHELDQGAFQEHVAWQIDQGTHGLVPCGTTGESPALADVEQERLVTLCVEVPKDNPTHTLPQPTPNPPYPTDTLSTHPTAPRYHH